MTAWAAAAGTIREREMKAAYDRISTDLFREGQDPVYAWSPDDQSNRQAGYAAGPGVSRY